MNKLECKEFEFYINNPESEEARINAIGIAYMELSNRVMNNHPELDEDRVRDYCWECVNSRLGNDVAVTFKTYGTFLSHAESAVLTHYQRMEKKYIKTLPLDDCGGLDDSTQNLVEECLERIVLEKAIKLLKLRLNGLSPKKRKMVIIKYLSNNGEGVTMQELANALGVSTSRINEIIQRGLDEMARTKLTNRESQVVDLKQQNLPDAVIRNRLKIAQPIINNSLKRVEKVKLSNKIKELYDLI